jgi:hypothetical protein
MEIFVVRVRDSGQGEPGLRGVVDEVASGCRSTFQNAEELAMILTKQAPARGPRRTRRVDTRQAHAPPTGRCHG